MRIFFLPLLAVLVAPGCVNYTRQSTTYQTTRSQQSSHWPKEDRMEFQYFSRDGHAVLECERAVLVFTGVSPRQQKAFHFQNGKQAVQVGGSGGSTVEVQCRVNTTHIQFRSIYASGTNTLQFGRDSVRFTEGGRWLLAGEKRIDLGEVKKVVRLARGQATVEP